MDYFSTETTTSDMLLTGLLIISIGLSWANSRSASMMLSILNRWVRWITISFAGAHIVVSTQLILKPFWVMFLICILAWFLVETTYHWLAIKALSQSSVPLFPAFRANANGEEWPAQKRFFKVRKWLKENDFTLLSSLKAELLPEYFLRLHIYQSSDNKHRVQVLFIPQRNQAVTSCYTITSQTVEGTRYITDNLFMPFGGFYPENWFLQRKPLSRNLKLLFLFHKKRLENTKEVFVNWDEEAQSDVNEQQKGLERLNTELGFLFPTNLREEYGNISFEGRYRVWKEIWMLNYFGKSFTY